MISLFLRPPRLITGGSPLSHTLLIIASLSLSACIEDPQTGPMISAITPEILSPGEAVTVVGQRLADPLTAPTLYHASIGGRPLIVDSWTPERVQLKLPLNVPGGERLLTLSLSGRPLATAPVYVDAPLGEANQGGGRLPPPLDRDAGQTPSRDQGPPRDLDPPDATPDLEPPDDIQLSYSPEREGADLNLEPSLVRDAEGALELRLTVTLSESRQMQTWGVASQLRFPAERLSFIGITQERSRTLQATEPSALPGRVLFYKVNPTLNVLTLRFRILDPEGELSSTPPLNFSFIERFSGLRDLQKQPSDALWSGGELRYVAP